MQRYEYKVVPAPVRGEKVRGLKTTADRFAQTMTLLMNEMARDGWEYLRADTLPCEERTGLTSRTTTYQNLLVFRRAQAAGAAPLVPGATVLAAPPVALPPEEPSPLLAISPEGDAPRLQPHVEEGNAPKLGPAS